MSSAAEPTTIPVLGFAVERVVALAPVAVPTLEFQVRISADMPVRSLTLNVQLRIEAARRRYDDDTQKRLADLFGRPERWPTTVRSLLWTHASLVVPAFDGETVAQLRVPCTYDFEIAAARYLDALRDGDVPLELLFSGTIFYAGDDGRLQAAHVPWDREAGCRMPVEVWREAVDGAFPGTAWLRLSRDCFDRLAGYRSGHGLPTWEAAVERLLDGADE
ncbi:MAG: DUF6084 family protein [Gaiellales bacterium]